jgi:hypothetical protein
MIAPRTTLDHGRHGLSAVEIDKQKGQLITGRRAEYAPRDQAD